MINLGNYKIIIMDFTKYNSETKIKGKKNKTHETIDTIENIDNLWNMMKCYVNYLMFI